MIFAVGILLLTATFSIPADRDISMHDPRAARAKFFKKFFTYAKRGNFDAIMEILQLHPGFLYVKNNRDHDFTLLHYAAEFGHTNILHIENLLLAFKPFRISVRPHCILRVFIRNSNLHSNLQRF